MQPQYYGAAADYNKPKTPKLLSKKLLLIGGAVVVGLLVISTAFAILSAVSSGPRNDVARLIAREQQLQKVVTANARLLKNGDLKKVSAEAALYSASDATALTSVFGGDVPSEITASETDATVETKLKDATQAGKFDEVYAQIVTSQVDACLTLAQKIKDQTGGQQTRAAAAQAVVNLTSLADQLQKITP